MKVLLVLVDGMRPDALDEVPEARRLMQTSRYSMKAKTVFPPVTLPCHMSLFHSVNPDRHGTTTNIYAPQVRPVRGLCEVLHQNHKQCVFFYNWEELRDLSRPDSLAFSCFVSGHSSGYAQANQWVTEQAIDYISKTQPDFAFVYLGWSDEAGHNHGWGSPQYQEAVQSSWRDIDRLMQVLTEDYAVIITADHGGHGRGHGVDIPEDMTIPVILHGMPFSPGEIKEEVSILDLAPTIAALLDTEPDEVWEGRNLLRSV